MVAFLILFIKRARDGKYSIDQENKLAIFAGLGEWIMTLFEVKQDEKTPEKPTNPLPPTPEIPHPNI